MARLKRSRSLLIDMAAARAAGLKSIDPSLDFGDGLTLARLEEAIANAQAKLAAYNEALSHVDEAKLEAEAAESEMSEFAQRMLALTAGKYGRRSTAYVKAGGRPRSRRKPAADPAATVIPIQQAA